MSKQYSYHVAAIEHLSDIINETWKGLERLDVFVDGSNILHEHKTIINELQERLDSIDEDLAILKEIFEEANDGIDEQEMAREIYDVMGTLEEEMDLIGEHDYFHDMEDHSLSDNCAESEDGRYLEDFYREIAEKIQLIVDEIRKKLQQLYSAYAEGLRQWCRSITHPS